MRIDISVIVPIYKGKQFIPYWLDTIQKNAVYLSGLKLQCELIFVNDYPEEKIVVEDLHTYGFELKVLNSNENRGIQGARIYGLEHAEGEWIVFLDQDDWITEDYLIKQKQCIDGADAVICNGYIKYFCKNINQLLYADNRAQECTKDLSYYISKGNPIFSPGQVMIRRESIPKLWCQNKLEINGADDYFLWILMLKSGKKFLLNYDTLYTHVGHSKNVSNNRFAMSQSVHRVEQILIERNLLNEEEKEIIKSRKIIDPVKYKSSDIIMVYDYWLYLEHRQQNIADFLYKNGYSKIGIYGMSSLGNRLYDLLVDSDVEAVFAIDRRAGEFICKIPVLCLDDTEVEQYIRQVDAVIVTAISDFELIKNTIMNRYEVSVLSLRDILLEMIENIKL